MTTMFPDWAVQVATGAGIRITPAMVEQLFATQWAGIGRDNIAAAYSGGKRSGQGFDVNYSVGSGEGTAAGFEYLSRQAVMNMMAIREEYLNTQNTLGNINSGLGAFSVGISSQNEIMDFAVRISFKSSRTWREFSALRETQQAWRMTNTLGKLEKEY